MSTDDRLDMIEKMLEEIQEGLGHLERRVEQHATNIADLVTTTRNLAAQVEALENGTVGLEPCQPIGCDNGYHLPGCQFAGLDAQ